jgi:hypothetical protein
MNYVLAFCLAAALLWLHPLKVEAPRSYYRPASGDYKPAVLTFSCPEKDRIKRARERMERVRNER